MTPPKPEPAPFDDVPEDAFYFEAVRWAQKNGVTNGRGDGTFGPNDPCTRGQIVTLLWRAAGSPEPKAACSMADVAPGSYCEKAVAWAAENGIVSGYADGTFRPDAPCTRAQSVTFLYRARGAQAKAAPQFSDVPADSYYAAAVAWAAETGVTRGFPDGRFAPGRTCTRGQIITFLYRAYQGK